MQQQQHYDRILRAGGQYISDGACCNTPSRLSVASSSATSTPVRAVAPRLRGGEGETSSAPPLSSSRPHLSPSAALPPLDVSSDEEGQGGGGGALGGGSGRASAVGGSAGGSGGFIPGATLSGSGFGNWGDLW